MGRVGELLGAVNIAHPPSTAFEQFSTAEGDSVVAGPVSIVLTQTVSVLLQALQLALLKATFVGLLQGQVHVGVDLYGVLPQSCVFTKF